MNSPQIFLATPIEWSAALLPGLESMEANVMVCPVLSGPKGSPLERAEAPDPSISPVGLESDSEFVMHVVYVDAANAVQVAEWWGKAGEKARRRGALVVVGKGGLRYEWRFRELGAIHVVGSVAAANQIVGLAHRWLRQFPKSDDKWPAWIHARAAEWSGT